MRKMGKAVVLSTGILFAGASVSIAPIGGGYAEAASATVKFTKTTYLTTSNLNMRSGAGTKYKVVMTLPKGAVVTSSERLGNWYKVTYNYKAKGKQTVKTGWVSGTYLKPKPAADSVSTAQKFTKTTFQVTSGLNMRTGAGSQYKILLTIPKGKTVTSSEKLGSWYKVSYTYASGGKKVTKAGWVSGSYLKEYDQFTSIKTTYFFTKTQAKLSLTPNTKNPASYTIAGGNGFTSTGKVVNSIGQTWYRVHYNGKYYYVNSSEVTQQTFNSFAETKYKAIKTTNLYASFGTSYPKLTSLPAGTILSSKERIGNWLKVSYNGKAGYVFAGDFSKYNAPAETAISILKTYLAISDVKLAELADSGSATLLTIKENTEVSPTHITSNGWYKVNFGGKIGYLPVSSLREEPAKEEVIVEKEVTQTFVVTMNLNLREKPGLESAVLAVIPDRTVVSPTHKTDNGWYKVTFNGKTGYVSGLYLQEVTAEPPAKPEAGEAFTEAALNGQTYLIKANLNVRLKPDASTTILVTIPQGKIVIPTHKTSNNWYKVAYGGKIGYISGTYVEQVKTGDPIYSRDSYQFIDLRTQAPVTAAQINNYIAAYSQRTGKASVLSNKGQVIVDAGRRHGVNALYLAAHGIHESGYGTSLISLGKFNLFGFGAFDATPFVGAVRFSSIDSSIDYIAREMKSTYLNPLSWKYKGAYLGFSTKTLSGARIDANSEGMNFYYASDENWGKTIARHMANILPYDKAYYQTAAINTIVPTKPATPAGSDFFPAGTVAVAKKDLVLDSTRGANDGVKTIKKGTAFTFLEKTNDYWVRVKADGKEYWTNDIRFDVYASYISVRNLGRSTATSLNIRAGAGTSYSIIGSYTLNEYIELALNPDGTIITNSDKTWYQVKLPNGTKGWTNNKYIQRELQ